MPYCVLAFSLSTGRAAAPAAYTFVSPVALDAGRNRADLGPLSETVFMIFVHTAIAAFQSVVQTRLSLAYNLVYRILR